MLLTVPSLTKSDGVSHFFGTRDLNLRDPSLVLGIPVAWRVTVKQVHGDGVLVLNTRNPGDTAHLSYDAMITERPGHLLVIRTADCVPILLVDRRQRVVGAAHAGWRGTARRIAVRTVEAMARHFNTRPEDIAVGFGPSVGHCCYEVDGPVLEPLKREFTWWREVVRSYDQDREIAMLDLEAWNRRQLSDIGVLDAQMASVQACTRCHADRFYSYRREGQKTGSLLSGIMIK
jgi:YfiH family protein